MELSLGNIYENHVKYFSYDYIVELDWFLVLKNLETITLLHKFNVFSLYQENYPPPPFYVNLITIISTECYNGRVLITAIQNQNNNVNNKAYIGRVE